jgi:hypothetical protein
MKNNISNIVKAIIPYEALLTAIRFIWHKRTLSVIAVILLPIIVIYVMVYMMLFLMSFVTWKLPDSIPIPFYHSLFSIAFDRVLLVIGMVLLFMTDGYEYD